MKLFLTPIEIEIAKAIAKEKAAPSAAQLIKQLKCLEADFTRGASYLHEWGLIRRVEPDFTFSSEEKFEITDFGRFVANEGQSVEIRVDSDLTISR